MEDADKLILIGRVAGAHGVRGEVRIVAYGDDPMALVSYRDLKREDGRPGLTVLSGRVAKDALVAKTAELTDKEAADALKGLKLFVPRSALPEPEEDEYYLTDLIGLQARSPDGEQLGKVINVADYGAGDILEIQPQRGASWLVAFTQDAVPQVQVKEGWLEIVRPEEITAQPDSDHDEDSPDDANSA
jgi:16S rRNA processing protein RimM